jgi:hypothetical protein
LDLVLQKAGKEANDVNLFDATGKLHGYQPYDFAASDFAQGVQKSIYGESRVINVRNMGMQIRVKVAEVRVEPILRGPEQPLRYQFGDLTLEITTYSLDKGGVPASRRSRSDHGHDCARGART